MKFASDCFRGLHQDSFTLTLINASLGLKFAVNLKLACACNLAACVNTTVSAQYVQFVKPRLGEQRAISRSVAEGPGDWTFLDAAHVNTSQKCCDGITQYADQSHEHTYSCSCCHVSEHFSGQHGHHVSQPSCCRQATLSRHALCHLQQHGAKPACNSCHEHKYLHLALSGNEHRKHACKAEQGCEVHASTSSY